MLTGGRGPTKGRRLEIGTGWRPNCENQRVCRKSDKQSADPAAAASASYCYSYSASASISLCTCCTCCTCNVWNRKRILADKMHTKHVQKGETGDRTFEWHRHLMDERLPMMRSCDKPRTMRTHISAHEQRADTSCLRTGFTLVRVHLGASPVSSMELQTIWVRIFRSVGAARQQ